MTYLDVIILGIVQGASEFLPISSSGHLVIFQSLLGINSENIFLEVALHFGTLISVLIYFRRDILKLLQGFYGYLFTKEKQEFQKEFKYCLCLFYASIPIGIGGLLLKSQIESAFESTVFTGVMLLVTAIFLLATKYIKHGSKEISNKRASIIGIAQLAAVLPGISRSGSTITMGIFLGMNPSSVARFSFILSVPAVGAAFVLKLKDALEIGISSSDILLYSIGATIAFLTGLLAIYFLLKLIASFKFYLFGFWCLLAGIFTLFYFR